MTTRSEEVLRMFDPDVDESSDFPQVQKAKASAIKYFSALSESVAHFDRIIKVMNADALNGGMAKLLDTAVGQFEDKLKDVKLLADACRKKGI